MKYFQKKKMEHYSFVGKKMRSGLSNQVFLEMTY